MEVKEGIGFINDLEIYIHDDYPEFREYKEAFIALLQQGEALKAENVELKAYKQMWTELEGEFWSKSDKDKLHMNFENFSELLTSMVHKYLKEANPNEANTTRQTDNEKE